MSFCPGLCSRLELGWCKGGHGFQRSVVEDLASLMAYRKTGLAMAVVKGWLSKRATVSTGFWKTSFQSFTSDPRLWYHPRVARPMSISAGDDSRGRWQKGMSISSGSGADGRCNMKQHGTWRTDCWMTTDYRCINDTRCSHTGQA